MKNIDFRRDINGLRAIAVIAVVLFHFNSSWMPGGFAGVDVFFVISGFLMTGIIFRRIEQENFCLLKFYVERANRIIPALAVLCAVLIVFGWFYLTPLDYKELGKHIGSSMFFLSNITYWREAGYFDSASHEKWLLHTWSLSAEWQFYIIYPLILVFIRKFMSLKMMKATILIGTLLGFVFCIIATYKWSDAAYYLLPARAWEMMIGGVAYLYPLKISDHKKKIFEYVGLSLIISSYIFISKESAWPGFLSFISVLGTFLIIQSQRNNSIVTGNIILQNLGKWSYSIYLWHWPIVVSIYYFSLNEKFIYLGIALSIILGFLSNKYVEGIKFSVNFNKGIQYLKCKPIGLVALTGMFGGVIFVNNGFSNLAPDEYKRLINNAAPSPYREKCHIGNYQDPTLSCEYSGENISWATFGDSHTVEIAYALAEKLKSKNQGLKHFSFSACKPSYKDDGFNICSKWYNETVNYIIANENIKNVVFNHRFTAGIVGGTADNYPDEIENTITNEAISVVKKIDELILLLASKKNNVYVFYPIPELPRSINQLIAKKLRGGHSLDNIVGTDLKWQNTRNKYINEHFEKSTYPSNVHLLKSKNVFCDDKYCYAVRDGIPLYFDDNHPSVAGAVKLVELIKM